MENLVTMKIELDISAQKILSHMKMHNETIEKQIQKGLELAINDITEGNNFVEAIRETIKKEIQMFVHKTVLSYEFQSSLNKMIRQKMGEKLEQYADQMAEKITASLNSNNPEP